MNAAERRALYQQHSKQLQDESFRTRNDTGRFKSIFDQTKMGNIPFYRDKDQLNELYIVPYITGSKHPTKGEAVPAFWLDVWVHRDVGPNGDQYVCMNRTFSHETVRRRCAICEYAAELNKQLEKEKAAGLISKDDAFKKVQPYLPTRRAIFNVVVCKPDGERGKGLQVWDASHFNFMKPVEELANKDPGGGSVPYADVNQGRLISFVKSGKGVGTKFTGLEFKTREAIPDSILEQAVALDEIVHWPKEDEVEQAFYAGLAEHNGELKPTGDGEDGEAPITEEPARRPKLPTPAASAPPPADVPPPEALRGPHDVEPEAAAPAPPPAQPAPPPPAAAAPAAEAPKPSLSLKKKAPAPAADAPPAYTYTYTACPSGAALGADFNEYEECDGCKAREDCAHKNVELKNAEAGGRGK